MCVCVCVEGGGGGAEVGGEEGSTILILLRSLIRGTLQKLSFDKTCYGKF